MNIGKRLKMRKMEQQIIADKREIKDFPKFAYRRTSFIRKTLAEMAYNNECWRK